MHCGRDVENSFFKKAAILMVAAVSGVFRALGWRACRFYPSCSSYAREAFDKNNFFRAFWLMIQRILRCHPLSPGGYDPVPTDLSKKEC